MSDLRVLPALVCVLVCAAPTAAQTTAQDPMPLTLRTGPDRVTFTFPTATTALEWRLEVAGPQDESVFDSGVVRGASLEWPLVDRQGHAVETGVYRYTLTMRTGGAEARLQRGELRIDRGPSLYEISVVSSDAAGVTLTPMEAASTPVPASDLTSPSVLRRSLSGVSFAPLISGTGTTGAITKWIDGPTGVVGDTNVMESNASVIVGNGTYAGNLHIFGPATSDIFSGMGANLVSGPAFNFGYAGATFGRSAGFFNVRPDASASPPNPSLRFMTANTERMIVTNTGNVGIGTSAPFQKLHLSGPNARLRVESALDNVWTVTEYVTNLREWHTGVGASNVVNDVKDKYYVYDANAGQFRLVIDTDGRVGIGSTNPAGKLYVVDSGNAVTGQSTTSGSGVYGLSYSGYGVYGSSATSTGVQGSSASGTGVYGSSVAGLAGHFDGNVTVTGSLTVNGTCFCTLSDLRLKQDIVPLNYGLQQVLQLRPVSWQWKTRATAPRDVGLIAQEVEPLLPELVQRASDDPNEPLRLNYAGLVPVLINAIQEQQAALDQKDAEIQRLQTRDRDQERRLTALEARLHQLLQRLLQEK